MRTLFLHHQQRRPYREEPGYNELLRPFVASGRLDHVEEYVYQTTLRELIEYQKLAGHSDSEAWLHANEVFAPLFAQVIETTRPDLVVYAMTWHTEAIYAQVFDAARRCHDFKLYTQFWDYDEGNADFLAYEREIVAASDYVAVTDSHARVERIHARAAPYCDWSHGERVHFLPTIFDPDLFCPAPTAPRYDISMLGSSEGERNEIADWLHTRYGARFQRLGGFMKEDRYLSVDDYVDCIRASRISINTQTRPERVQIKGRAKEVLACGGFLLEQDNPESRRFLEGSGVEFFSGFEELGRKLDYWLEHESERAKRAAESCAWYRARSRPDEHVDRILAALFPGPDQPRQQPGPGCALASDRK